MKKFKKFEVTDLSKVNGGKQLGTVCVCFTGLHDGVKGNSDFKISIGKGG